MKNRVPTSCLRAGKVGLAEERVVGEAERRHWDAELVGEEDEEGVSTKTVDHLVQKEFSG